MAQFASTLYPQTNPTNPILLMVRDDLEKWPAFSNAIISSNLELLRSGRANVLDCRKVHVDHARRVLTRLAALTG